MRRRRIKRNRFGRIVGLRCDLCGMPKGMQHYRRLDPIRPTNGAARRSTTCKRCEAKGEARIAAEALSARARLSWS